MAGIDFSSLYDLPDKPNQPGPALKFPKCSFGKKNIVQRCFQHSWFEKCPFLHYKEDTDTVLFYLPEDV